jgi:hypothetical protein
LCHRVAIMKPWNTLQKACYHVSTSKLQNAPATLSFIARFSKEGHFANCWPLRSPNTRVSWPWVPSSSTPGISELTVCRVGTLSHCLCKIVNVSSTSICFQHYSTAIIRPIACSCPLADSSRFWTCAKSCGFPQLRILYWYQYWTVRRNFSGLREPYWKIGVSRNHIKDNYIIIHHMSNHSRTNRNMPMSICLHSEVIQCLDSKSVNRYGGLRSQVLGVQ